MSKFSIANQALREKNYVQAILNYLELLQGNSFPFKDSIAFNFGIARKKYRAAREKQETKRVAVCGWELSHNAAGRVYTLAQLYETFVEVEIIGSIFPQFGSELWEPIRNTTIPVHCFQVTQEALFLEQALKLVTEHPYDVIHLSKPRIPNIFFGILYKLIWGSTVFVDIDDEELAFVNASNPISIEEYIKIKGSLPELSKLSGHDWTQIAVGLVYEFDGITVSNPALQQRYGGEIIRHARDEKRYNPSPELKQKSREKFGIPLDKKVVLFFGTPRKHKGLLETADALAQLNRDDVLYVIVGDFPKPELKQQLLAKKGVNYHFIGNQPYDSIPEVVAMGDICILLQDLNSLVSQFQVPAKLSDALGMGLIIITNIPIFNLEYLSSDFIFYLKEGNLISSELSKAIKLLEPKEKKEYNAAKKIAISQFRTYFSFQTNTKNIRSLAYQVKNNFSQKKAPIIAYVSNFIGFDLFISFHKINNSNVTKEKKAHSLTQKHIFNFPIYLLNKTITKPHGVSCIILNRNGEKLLKNLLESFLQQNFNSLNVELLIIDHASTDSSIEVLTYFKTKLPLRIFSFKENYTFSYSNNYAAKKAKYETLLFINNDIVLTQNNTLHQLLEGLTDETVGLVGACLRYPQKHIHANQLQHTGIRFQPDKKNAFFRPFNLAHSNITKDIFIVPAVTAALLLCRKQEFLELGGFCEDYNYGYEDVDLCLQYRSVLSKHSILLANVEAEHNESATQKTNLGNEVRTRRTKNISYLRQRYGFALKWAWKAEFASKQHFWGEKVPVVGFAVTEAKKDTTAGDYFTALELATALQTEFGWSIKYLSQRDKMDEYDLADIDILVVMIDRYELPRIHSAPAHLVKIAWMRNWFERWAEREWFSDYDIFLCSSLKAREFIQEKYGKVAHVLRIAVNTKRFTPPSQNFLHYDSDYCFTGSYWNAKRDIEQLQPQKLGYRFAIYGHGWDKHEAFKPFWKGFLAYEKLPNVYRHTKILLDDANSVTKPWGSVNSRVFDAIAAGCLVITNGEIGAQEVFGDDLPVYRDEAELEQLLKQYLEDDQARQQLNKKLRALVLEKHTYTNRAHELQAILEAYYQKSFRIAIKVPVPKLEVAHEWGDYHFALALKRAFVKQGHSVRIDILPNWYCEQGFGDDVALVLRGLSEYKPSPNQINLMWNISHPDKISDEEYERYDHVFVASISYAKQLAAKLNVPVTSLLQCTDEQLFYPDKDLTIPAHPILFVGNSRNQYRHIVKHALEANLPITVYGNNWEAFINKKYLAGKHISNTQLRKYYSRCNILLNDHWPSMSNNGFISNRLFDAGACGAVIVSDEVEGLNEIFGNMIITYDKKSAGLVKAVQQAQEASGSVNEELSKHVLSNHTFTQRAAQILSIARNICQKRTLQLSSDPSISVSNLDKTHDIHHGNDLQEFENEKAKPLASPLPLPPAKLRFMNENDAAFIKIGTQNFELLQEYGFSSNSNLLDIGCGYGRMAYAIIYNQKTYFGQYTGLDILPAHINWCQSNITVQCPNLNFFLMDIRNDRYNPLGKSSVSEVSFDFSNLQYDFSCLFSVFTHMYEDEIVHYLKEINSVLKVGGICIATFFLYTSQRLEKLAQHERGLTMRYELNDHTRYHNPDDKLHAISFEQQYILDLCEKLGYQVLDCQHGHWAGGNNLHYQDAIVLKKLEIDHVYGVALAIKGKQLSHDLDLSSVKRINVGAGPNCDLGEGWYNVDIRKFPGIHFVMDVTKEWSFKNLDYVYGEHFLEHLRLDHAIKFLEEAGNSLRVGGKIRLSTPCLEWVMLTHFRNGEVDEQTRIADTLKLNRGFHGWGHQFLWTKSFLKKVLESMGYINITFFGYGESDDFVFQNIERHGNYSVVSGEPSVIIVEATKGQQFIKLETTFMEYLYKDFLRHVVSGH